MMCGNSVLSREKITESMCRVSLEQVNSIPCHVPAEMNRLLIFFFPPPLSSSRIH